METTTTNMQEFRNSSKIKRSKGRPRITEEERSLRIRSKAIRLKHINDITSEKGLVLIKTIEDERACYKWTGENGTVQKKLEKLDKYEIIIFTNKLATFTLDQWLEDFERVSTLIF